VEALILLGSDEVFSGPCFTAVLALSFFLLVTIWVTSLGSNCEVTVFAHLLFYPSFFGVPKWFTALPLSRGTPLACIDQVEHYIKSVPESVRVAVESLDHLLKSSAGTDQVGKTN